MPASEGAALAAARQDLGYKGRRLPWFGCFAEHRNGITIYAPYSCLSDLTESIDIALGSMDSGRVYIFDCPRPIAGKVAG